MKVGTTPEKLLPFVLEDGFEFNEEFIRKVKEGLAQADAGNLISHEEAMSRLDAVIDSHAAKKRAA